MGEKPLACPVCQKKFGPDDDWKQHLLSHQKVSLPKEAPEEDLLEENESEEPLIECEVLINEECSRNKGEKSCEGDFHDKSERTEGGMQTFYSLIYLHLKIKGRVELYFFNISRFNS